MFFPADIVSLDKSVSLAVNNALADDSVNGAWALITDKYTWIPVYVLLLLFLFWRIGWKRTLIILVAVLLAVLVSDRVSSIVKAATERLRPCHDPWMLASGIELPIGQGGGRFGFFSGHAANSFALVTTLFLGIRAGRPHRERALIWGGFAWAAIMALSRVVTARHFVGDILVGAAFGVAVGILFGLLSRWAILRFAGD